MTHQSRYQTFAEMDLSAVDINTASPSTKGIASWVRSTADLWAAAALYDALRRLSDAELHKRGFSRDTLVRDVLQSGAHIARG